MVSTPVKRSCYPYAIFVAALLLPVVYLVAAFARWINWAAWLPVVMSVGFVALAAAVRISHLSPDSASPK